MSRDPAGAIEAARDALARKHAQLRDRRAAAAEIRRAVIELEAEVEAAGQDVRRLTLAVAAAEDGARSAGYGAAATVILGWARQMPQNSRVAELFAARLVEWGTGHAADD